MLGGGLLNKHFKILQNKTTIKNQFPFSQYNNNNSFAYLFTLFQEDNIIGMHASLRYGPQLQR